MTEPVDHDATDSDAADSDEQRELEALRAEVAALHESGAGATRPRRHIWRWVGCWVLVVVTAVLVLTAVVARFAESELLDTERYVETVGPLADDPAIQAEIADQVTDQVTTRIDVEGVTADALAGLAERAPRLPEAITGLAPVIAGQVESFIHGVVTRLVTSEEFPELWTRANRTAHQSLVAVLTGETGGVVTADDSGTVSLSTSAVLDRVRDRLTARGFSLAERIPDVDAEIVLLQSDDLVRVQRAVSFLDSAASVLPWLAVLTGLGAVGLAPRGSRRKAVVAIGVAAVVAMALLALAINAGRALYLREVPSDVLSPAAATAVIDTLLVPLRTTLRAVFVAGLVIALAAYLTGSTRSAQAIRSGVSSGLDRLRSGRLERPASPVEAWVSRYRRALQIGIVAIAAAVLVFWRYPSGAVVAVLAVVAALALLAVEFVARDRESEPTQP
ncbi:MAG TPA: hypothetical protein VIP77_00795 [Jiangellaceae bacterium]